MSRKKIWGWYFIDWASQPYNTLLITFIFGPYVVSVIGDGSQAQSVWGYGTGLAGMVVALFAPFLGAIADRSSQRIQFMWAFSALYVVGSFMLWFSAPDSFNVWLVMFWFSIGILGMEFIAIFANAMLPDIASREKMGRVSGAGWGFGYVGGVVSLLVMLCFFVEGSGGTTLIGLSPAFGLDPATREGTRAVGPITAIWYIIFIIPFFAWMKDEKKPTALPIKAAARVAWPELKGTLSMLPARPSLFVFLMSSMFCRDAISGMFIFGGVFASGVLGWSITQVGVFGIVAAVSGALFAWLGGKADSRFGPKPVIIFSVLALTFVAFSAVSISKTSVFWVSVAPDSIAPDIVFYIFGAIIGGAGGMMYSAGRTMMIIQSPAGKVTQFFGIYALAGKATSFISPLAIGVVTSLSGSQQIGILPVGVLFIIGLILMKWVKPEGDKKPV